MRYAVLCLVLAALPSAAVAEELTFLQKMEISRACEKDVATLCGDVERGGGRLLQCVRDNASKLSQPCHDAISKLRGDLLAAVGGEPMDY